MKLLVFIPVIGIVFYILFELYLVFTYNASIRLVPDTRTYGKYQFWCIMTFLSILLYLHN